MSEHLLNPQEAVPWGFSYSRLLKKRPEPFAIGIRAFFQKFDSNDLLCLKEKTYNMQTTIKNPWGPLQNIFLGLSYSVVEEEKAEFLFFSHAEDSFPSNIFSLDLLGPEEVIL